MTPRVVLGAGAVDRLPAELDRAGWRRAFVISTPGRAAETDAVAAVLGERVAARFDRAVPHVPVAAVGDALAALAPAGADVLVAVGGGSAIGLAKALALRTGLPIAAVPTTYAGSEMTTIWGLTDRGVKRTGRDPRVASSIVVYDARLTLSLPPELSAASGMNAMAHAVEALYAADADDETRARAESAARALAASLPRTIEAPDDLEAREATLHAAHDAAIALNNASMGLHHRLCHVLGGRVGLPHAMTHAVLLPHVVAFNAPAASEAMDRLASALGVGDAPAGLAALNRRLGIRARLRDLGLREADLAAAAAAAADGEYPNPRPASAEDVRAILAAAF